MSVLTHPGNLTLHVCRWMSELSTQRPIFHSEADFQLALAMVMSRNPRVSRIRLERRVRLKEKLRDRAFVNVDILARLDGRPVGLELKYPKRALECTAITDGEPEDFHLREGASDVDAAGFWQDAARMERLVVDEEIHAGVSVMLSNCPLWEQGRLLTTRSNAREFALYNGRKVEAGQSLAWREGAQAVDLNPVRLSQSYTCEWLPYSKVGERAVEFRYIVLEPGAGVP